MVNINDILNSFNTPLSTISILQGWTKHTFLIQSLHRSLRYYPQDSPRPLKIKSSKQFPKKAPHFFKDMLKA